MKMLECDCGQKVKVEDNCVSVRCSRCTGRVKDDSEPQEKVNVEDIISEK